MVSLSKENYNPEEFLLDTLNDLEIGFVKVSVDGIILNHNLTFNKIFGYNLKESLIDTKILDYWLNLEERNKFREILYKNSIVKKYITPLKKVDGGKIILQLNFKLNRNSSGVIVSSEGTFVDVSERIETEKKISESEEKYKTILNGIANGVWVTDKDDIIYYTNKGMEKIVGLPSEQIVNANILIDFPESTLKYFRPYYLKAKNTLKSVFYDAVPVETPADRPSFQSGWLIPIEKEGKYDGIICTVEDVTERVQNEEILKESEERFRRIIENAPVGYYRVGNDGLWQYVNPMWEKMHGYSFQDIIGKSFEITQPENAKEQARINVQQVLSGESLAGEFGRTKKDGNVEYHTFNIQPVYKKGEIIAIEGFINDITELKKTEQRLIVSESNLRNLNIELESRIEKRTKELNNSKENLRNLNIELESRIEERTRELKESEDKYRMMIDNLDIGFYRVNINGIYLNHNPEHNKILGIDPAKDLKGKKTIDFWQNYEDRQNYLQELNSKEFIRNYIVHGKKINGEKIVLQVDAHLIKDSKGERIAVEGTVADITEKFILEQKLKVSKEKLKKLNNELEARIVERTKNLKESEEKFAKAFHSSPNALAITKLEDGKIVDVNEGFNLMLGYSREEIIGKSTVDLNLWVNPNQRNSFLKALNDEKIVKNFEVEVRTKSGDILTTLFSGDIIKLNNEPYLISIATNITELKKSEQKLEELNIMKSEFLRRASHELKTPLISIKGFSELILSLYADQLDPPIISKVREINDGCERLQNIINNILKTSQLESPKLRPSKKKEDLSFLIKFCVNELESLAKRRNQSVKLDIHSELYANIEKEEIHDVISNLLSNAIKYTPPMGKIEIKTELKEDHLVVSVTDNGIGFTEEQKKKIFRQFGKIERYGQGLDLEIDGTGLGLYISKKILEAHGGKIWMESEGENKGSSFYFTLPTNK